MSIPMWGRMGDAPVILTRWFLIIAIAYAIIFSAAGAVPFWPHQAVIAMILGSNLVLAWVLARGKSWRTVSSWMTALDIAAVSMAISVAGNVHAEFYLVYFSILILSAVIDRRGRPSLTVEDRVTGLRPITEQTVVAEPVVRGVYDDVRHLIA